MAVSPIYSKKIMGSKEPYLQFPSNVTKWPLGEILPTYLYCCKRAVQTVEKWIMGKSVVPGFGEKNRIVLQVTCFKDCCQSSWPSELKVDATMTQEYLRLSVRVANNFCHFFDLEAFCSEFPFIQATFLFRSWMGLKIR